MRSIGTTSSVLALAAAGVLAGGAARGQQAPVPNTTPTNVNVLNLLAPFLSLNGTPTGQTALVGNLNGAVAVNNNAATAAPVTTPFGAQQVTTTIAATSISDKTIFGGASTNITLPNGRTMAYGPGANLGGGLPAQAIQNGATPGTITPYQPIGGLGLLGPAYQAAVSPAGGTVPAVGALLTTAYSANSGDLGVAKFYFANGTTNGTTAAVAPPGFTLPTSNGLPNKTNSVYDTAYGVSNTGANQDIYGDSRPVQVAPARINGYDPNALTGLASNPSFPSGHTNYAYTDGILIGMLVPQSFQSMLLRASEYGNSRIDLGVHYPLDIIASRSFVQYDLAQELNGTAGYTNLQAAFAAAQGPLQANLNAQAPAAGCGTLANCAATNPYNAYSLATYGANTPTANGAPTSNSQIYAARLTYGLPTIAGAPKELSDTQGLTAAILLAPLYGGNDSAPARTIVPAGGLLGNLATATINQIIVNTENDPLAAFAGTQLSYWSRINLYDAAGYFNNVVGTLSLAQGDQVLTSVTVNATGAFSGAGTVGTQAAPQSVTVNAGGSLAGGTLAAQAAIAGGAGGRPDAVLTVNGNVTFSQGSTYAVSASPTQVTSVAATGTAVLTGATVAVTQSTLRPYAGAMQIFSAGNNGAGGGLGNTTFAGVTSNLLFATPVLSYDPNTNVLLSFGGPDFTRVATTRNQNSVALALNNGAAANPNAPVVTALGGLTTAQAAQGAAALGSLEGSGLTATQNLAHRAAREFTSSIFDQTTAFGQAPGVNSVTFTDEFAARAQGFAPVRELADLPASRAAPAAAQPSSDGRPRSFRLWATGFGGAENISGNAAVGSGAENNTIIGGSAGIDYQFLPGMLVGVAAGGTGGSFNVPAFATSGSTTGGHVAGYTLMNFGPYYGAASLAGSFYTNRTTRTAVAGALAETDNGSFNSREIRLRLEAGRRFGVPGPFLAGGTVTPFVALEIADLRSSAFTEFNRAGPTLLGLNLFGQDSADVPAFVGARFERIAALGNGMAFTPVLQLAYVHEFAPQRSQLGSFAGLPQAVFLTNGARPAYNAAQVKAGAELAIAPRAALFATFDGEFSGVAQFYGGKGGFRYAF